MGQAVAPDTAYVEAPTGDKTAWERAHTEEEFAQADLIRDIFGNPFLRTTSPETLAADGFWDFIIKYTIMIEAIL